MKVNVSLNDDLLKKIDKYAAENYMSRSGLISLACTQLINASEATIAIKEMSLCFRKIADSGKIDEQSKKQLKNFEVFAEMLVGSKI